MQKHRTITHRGLTMTVILNTMGSWTLSTLRLENFRNYDHLDIDFDPHLTVLVGINGAGKTSVLDAISVLLSVPVGIFGGKQTNIAQSDVRSSPRLERETQVEENVVNYPVALEGNFLFAGTPITIDRKLTGPRNKTTHGSKAARDLFGDIKESIEHAQPPVVAPILAYYGVERLLKEIPRKSALPTTRLSGYGSSLDTRSDLNQLFAYIEYLDTQRLDSLSEGRDLSLNPAAQQLEIIFHACNEALSPTGWGRARWSRKVHSVVLTHPDYGTLPLTHMATGTKICAGLVLDLAARMGRLNPHLYGNALLDTTPGVVLIDEVDLHLHPQWQKEILGLLRDIFPAVQFIVSTHSPIVVAHAPTRGVRILSGNDVETPSFAQGLDLETIVHEIQGVNPTPATENRKFLNKYLSLVYDGKGKSDEARKLRAQVEETLGGVDLVEELSEADAFLFFEK